MTFQAIVPVGGYSGWRFLQRTMERQQEVMAQNPTVQREEDYFREKIGTITSAKELVSDRRLLKVALGAFGLDADINNRFFIQKVLESSELDKSALANRLSDKNYKALANAFGFGDSIVSKNQEKGFADAILAPYATRQFEVAVGEKNDSLRLALNARRELESLAGKTSSESTKWYTIMGSKPLREVFETALGLPASFGSLDIDQQLKTLQDKTRQLTGDKSVAQFTDPDVVEKVVRLYLIRSDSSVASTSSGSAALSILQSNGSAGSILASLLR